jgi:multidrug transporter EmrE-like cation transporter
MEKTTILMLAVGLSIVTAIADSLIKKATVIKSSTLIYTLIIIGAIIYAFTALGWYKVLQRMELLNAGVIYTLSFIILIALISVFYFKEKLLVVELVGLVLAIISIVIMYRFS